MQIETQVLETIVDNVKELAVIALVDGRFVGVCLVSSLEQEFAYISDFYVSDEVRRKGVGSALLQTIFVVRPDVYLAVKPDNIAAQELYKKNGFYFNGDTHNTSLVMVRENDT